ncbi:Ribosome-recycling factor [Thalassoglobus neptunius]|uniref:Ribosome-recycling factor n=2 Tax=Thalassoglobus neptunius TaxID=1938619 RepID=A0A5C5WQ14_9PLAN|nr:Ribosome-recycling factor [Thalassoglobus neptunius]
MMVTCMEPDEVLIDAEDRMQKAVDVFKDALQGLRTGRATPGLVDSVRVNYHGSPTPLKQLANISVPEPQQLVIRPFDQSILTEIVKAIQSSDAGMAPNSDGRLIRINVPALSTERRRELVQRVGKFAEDARVSIRNIRRDANKHVEQAEKDKTISEDQMKSAKDEIQELTKKFEGVVNDQAKHKEEEVMNE